MVSHASRMTVVWLLIGPKRFVVSQVNNNEPMEDDFLYRRNLALFIQ